MVDYSPSTPDQSLLILGGNGRLGTLLRRAWQNAPLPGWRPIWCARPPSAGIDAIWSAGHPPPCQAPAVLALWGAVPGAEDLTTNSHLAHASMALGRDCGATRVLHISSSAVYGPGFLLREDSPCHPNTPYGEAKLDMEKRIAEDSAKQGPDACILRLANVAGADSLFRALSRPDPIKLDRFTDGRGPRRSYATPAHTLSAISALLMADPLPGIINVATPGTVDMADLVRAAGRPFTWQDAPDDALEEVSLDTSALQELTNERTPPSPEDMIREWRHMTGVTA